MPLPELHLDRLRAESFGADADAYDRYRPAFPEALFDDLARLGPLALDVACGTGKVARGLLARGLSVLGVELDARMAAVARARGVTVEVAPFERWDGAGRRFDLITCGDAWHWLEPKGAAAKAAQVLRPGGTLVRFWNLQLLDEAVMAALEPVYRQHAPEVWAYGRPPPVTDADPLPMGPPFGGTETRTYPSERRVSGEEWAAVAGTISDHQRLPPERMARLLSALRSAIAPFGETIRVRTVTTALFKRLAEPSR